MHRLFIDSLALTTCLIFFGVNFAHSQEPEKSPHGIKTAEGFSAELVYDVGDDQGSWVSLAVDPKGRLIASDQYGKLYRLTMNDSGESTVESIDLKIGYAHGLLCAFDSLYVVAHANNEQPAGLYRVRDTDQDDQYDDVKLLRKFDGGGEHGPHAVIPGPDGKSLYICGGNHTKLPAPDTSRVPEVWQEDQVMPRLWDATGHAVGIEAPGGWVCQTDPNGEKFELISIGFRNQFDIAFNTAGDLFTYDADMEWDIGTTWYRPTRICHVVSGSEFGWRSGTGKWPEYYQDSLPAVVDIGPGSPTGIQFGTDAKFPEKYQRSLFIADWSYGIIYAVHMSPDGSTYSGEVERFCWAPALPVADIVVSPVDGAMYFVVGGRRTQSAVYRVKYTGSENTAKAAALESNGQASLRHIMENYHDPDLEIDEKSDQVAPLILSEALNAPDRFVRYAARTGLENRYPESLLSIVAQKADSPIAKIEMATAVARVGKPEDLSQTLDILSSINFDSIQEQEQLQLLRAYGLLRIRLDAEGATIDQHLNERFTELYPADSQLLNRELARLLSVTDSADFINKTMKLLDKAGSQHEKIHFALCLSHIKSGWTFEQRKEYFEWFFEAATIRGGNSLRGFLNNIRGEAIKTLDESTKTELGELITKVPQVENPYKELKARPFVQKWTSDSLHDAVVNSFEDADIENGRKMFSVGQCYACHRIKGDGGIVGPDLTAAGNRYSLEDLIATLVDPSKEVSDQYQATNFRLMNGKVVTGRVVNLNKENYMVQTDMINPAQMARIKVEEIDEMAPSSVSMMPEGLLDNLTAEEIRDLIAYMKSVSELDE